MANRRQKCWRTFCLSVPKLDNEADSLSYSTLFKYATSFEKACVFTASVFAIVSGCIPAVINILYGEFCNLMIDRQFPTQGPSTQVYVLPYFGGGKVLQNASSKERRAALKEDADAWGFGSAVLTVSLFVCCMLSIFLLCLTSSRQVSRIKVLFFKSIICKDSTWFDINMKRNLAGQASENLMLMERGMSDILSVFIFHMAVGLINIIISLLYGWMLTLILLGVISPVVLCAFFLAKYQNKLEVEGSRAAMRAVSVAEEAFTSIRTVITFGGESKELNRYIDSLTNTKAYDIKRNIAAGISNGLVWFALYCSYSAAFAIGIRLIEASRTGESRDLYTPAVVIIIFFGIVTALMSLGYATSKLGVFSTACAAGAVIFNTINDNCSINPCSDSGKQLLEGCKGDIEFKQVFFEYPARPGVTILKGLNLKIKAGQTVAIVGESGSGKSTLVNLLQRFYDPEKGIRVKRYPNLNSETFEQSGHKFLRYLGNVFLDGHDLKALNVSWLRSQIGVVDEQPSLFGTSIRENIWFGNVRATDEELLGAAKRAHAYDFIKDFKDGFNTDVGHHGSRLSGGQKQRIAIARVLVGNPKILVLDEATRALDVTNESLVQEELIKTAAGRTTLIITNRLSTIVKADRIVVMSNGVIVEEGTHNDLLKANGVYRHLFQTEGEEPHRGPKKSAQRVSSTMLALKDSGILPPGPRGRLHSITGVPRTSLGSFHRRSEQIKDIGFADIVKWTKPQLNYFLCGSLGSIICGITLPVLCILYGDLVGFLALRDISLSKTDIDYYAYTLIAIGAATGISVYTQLFCFGTAAVKLCAYLRIKTFRCIVHQDVSYFDDENNTVRALCLKLSRDPTGIQATFDIRLGILVQSVTAMAIGIVLSFMYNAKISLVTLTMIPFLFSGVYVESLFASGKLSGDSKAMERASQIAVETITNIRTVASLTCEAVFIDKYTRAIKEGQKSAYEKFFLRSFAFALGQAAPYIGYTVTLWYGGKLMAEDDVPFTEVIKIAELLIFGTWTLGQSLVFGPSLRETREAAGRLQYVFTKSSKVVDGLSDLPQDITTRPITFSKVHFAYTTSGFALQNLNLRIEPGKRTAVMGSSGSGKSSIIPLLLRLYDPFSGTIAVGRTNIRACRIATLRRKFGVVSQRTELFDRTIEENIAYGDNTRTVTLEEVMEAAKMANIHNFVMSLPGGYSTTLGTSSHLSNGQKQRIAIARILVRNPDVLLLDDATAGLDAETESLVQAALDAASAGRTTLSIATRLSAVKEGDMIYVLEKGTVKESGTQEELLQQRGLFFSMYGAEDEDKKKF